MFPLSVREICQIVGGTAANGQDTDKRITGVSINSRSLQPGDAFVALRGRNTHGVQFGSSALKADAGVVVLEKRVAAGVDYPHIAVDSAEEALTTLAQNNRNQSDALVVGVTGSVGKTTAKSMVTDVLSVAFPGMQSPYSFNNHLGVPLTLLKLKPEHEFAVVEIGASAPGETCALALTARPEFGLVTRIAPAHLQGFRTLDAVRKEKEHLIRALPQTGIAFLNADDPLVLQMAQAANCRVVTFGETTEADVRASNIRTADESLYLSIGSTEFHVPICGRHNSVAALAAIAIGMEVGLSPSLIQSGLNQFKAAPGRCNVQKIGPWTIIDDTYNSSPASVRAAVRTMADFSNCHHRILVIGDMLDLGDQSPELHFAIGASIAASSLDHVAVCGEYRDCVVRGFLTSGGHQNRISVFSEQTQLAAMLECIASPNDLILVKGSRETVMERVIESLRMSYETAPKFLRAA